MGRKSGLTKCEKARESLWYEQGGLCHWCGEPMNWSSVGPKPHPSGKDMTIDHLDDYPNRHIRVMMEPFKPRKRIVLACSNCNYRRGKDNAHYHPMRLTHFLEFSPVGLLTGRLD